MSPVQERDDPMRQFETPQHGFGVAGHFLERVVGRRRMDDLHHLDLVELVLADHSPRVLAVASRFRTETRRVRGQLDRQRLGRQDLAAHGVRERDLGRRDEVEPLVRRRVIRFHAALP
jgi:hypothetical protein